MALILLPYATFLLDWLFLLIYVLIIAVQIIKI